MRSKLFWRPLVMESLLFFDKVVLESYTIRSRKNVIVITK